MPVLLVLLLILAFPSLSYNASPEEELQKIQEKMQEQKKKIGEAQERESSVLSEIQNVNLKLGRIEEDLRKYRKSLQQTESSISAVNGDIEKTKGNLEHQKEWLNRKLRTMHRLGYAGDVVPLLMSASDMAQLMRIWKYLESITLYEHRLMGGYHENLVSLDERSTKLRALRAELKTTSDRIRGKELELAEKKRQKEVILSSVKNEKAAHQKMLSELKNASQRLMDLIKESSKTDTYAGKGFSQLKGKLFWPAEGKVAIPYGSQKDPQFDTVVFRNGIHIQTDAKADARSIYEGKVLFAEWFKGFGQLVIINHGDGYHSLYGNLSEIFSHAGDIIKENQVLGKVGTSGLLNTYGLYFEIRYKGKPLNPTQWLKNKRR